MITSDSLLAISTHLRTKREKRNLSIAELALQANVSEAAISKIENARRVPSLEELEKLSKALSINLSSFFLNIFSFKSDKYMVLKKNDRETFTREDSEGVTYEPLLSFDIQNSLVRSSIVTIKAGTERPPISTDAIELNYIISGGVMQIIDNEEIFLETGDACFLKSTFPHAMHNKTTTDCVMFVVYFMNV